GIVGIVMVKVVGLVFLVCNLRYIAGEIVGIVDSFVGRQVVDVLLRPGQLALVIITVPRLRQGILRFGHLAIRIGLLCMIGIAGGKVGCLDIISDVGIVTAPIIRITLFSNAGIADVVGNVQDTVGHRCRRGDGFKHIVSGP